MAVTEDRSTVATELITKARAAMDAGEKDAAFDCLDKAVSNTADPELIRQIHAMAKEGYDSAGFIARHTMWGGLVKATEHVLEGTGR